MNNKILILFTFLFLVSCQKDLIQPTPVCTEDSSLTLNSNHPKAVAIQAKMDEYIAKGIPGMTVLIADDDGIWIQSAGYADIENGTLMQPCHINKLGSVTKMMVGALVWQLIQDGLLDINEPIKTYIPDVASQITNGDDITLAMLLQHTSGIKDVGRTLGYNLAVINDYTRSWTSEEILPYIANQPATNLPGESANYSNTNTMLSGMIIEAVTGRPHGDLLKERIFQPLGMNSTVYYDYSEAFPIDRLAQGYLDFNNDGGAIQNISNLNPGSGNGYTGVYSTVSDLYLFMKALLVDKILTSEDNLDLIFDSFTEDINWTSIGGILREFQDRLPEDQKAYGHGGGDIGYAANLDYLPHNNTIFAASYNYGTNLRTDLGAEVWTLQGELMEIMAE